MAGLFGSRAALSLLKRIAPERWRDEAIDVQAGSTRR